MTEPTDDDALPVAELAPPRSLSLLIEAPGATMGRMISLRPVDYWDAREHSGQGDWGVGYTPHAAGTYRYRFSGENKVGEAATGPPTDWREWTVE